MAKYIIAGKTITVDKFILDRPNTYFANREEGKYLIGEKLINCRTEKIFYRIEENDTIILLQGWWGRSWAKQGIKDALIMFPQMKFEYHDGQFGESERKTLKSDRIHNRFEILDLRED
jgi:hypothetical protein